MKQNWIKFQSNLIVLLNSIDFSNPIKSNTEFFVSSIIEQIEYNRTGPFKWNSQNNMCSKHKSFQVVF